MINILTNDKFNTITLQISFNQVISKEKVTKRALIPSVLYSGSKIYKTQTIINQKLDQLYGANLSVGSTKQGNLSRMTFTLKFINPKVVDDKDYTLKKVYDVLKEIVFNPKVNSASFDDKTVENEKSILVLEILRQKENKAYFAVKSAINELYNNTIYSIESDGYVEDAKKITSKNLYEYYLECLKEDEINVCIVGDLTLDDVSFIDITNNIKLEKENYVKEFAKSYKTEIIEKDAVNQSNLVVIYDNKTYTDSKNYANHVVLDYILGGSPTSLLFSNIREKHGLCYSVSSTYISTNAITLITAGISQNDYDKCLKLVNEQIDSLKEANFEKALVSDAIKSIKNKYLSADDSQSTYLRRLINKSLFDFQLSKEDYFKKLDSVTPQTLKEAAQAFEFKLSYFLRGEDNETN